jgi:3-hydroxybutyryl-CoA dehydrogenase
MQLVVLADEILKGELLSNGAIAELQIMWVKDVEEFAHYKNADGYIDLLFDNAQQRIDLLKIFLPAPVIVNSVAFTLQRMNAPFVRINAWPGFLRRPLVEASYVDEEMKWKVTNFFSALNKRVVWLEDKPGFVTAKVITMIINEAWFALEQGVSTKEDIDTAMKFGVNYPYGPFEWCDKIGIKNIHNLLNELSKTNVRYTPAAFFKNNQIGNGADFKY